MSPFEIKILLHIYTTPAEFPLSERSVPLHRETTSRFMDDGLITASGVCCQDEHPFKLTERGRVYLDAMMSLPLPEQRWVMPNPPPNQGTV